MEPAADGSPREATNDGDAANDRDAANNAVLAALQSQAARLARLEEDNSSKGLVKKLTSSAGAMALFLGLILTFQSLYDGFVTKPEADRVARLSKFNDVVNSVAKRQQEAMQLITQATDPKLRLAIASAITPQVLSDLSTAQAMLRDLDDKDVGIPQLIVLMNAASSEGDWPTVKSFVDRAVNKTDVSPFLHSEALRFEGKYWFTSGDPERGRQSFLAAFETLGTVPVGAAARAFVLGDLVATEYLVGACRHAAEDFNTLVANMASPYVGEQPRSQISASVVAQLASPGAHCPAPPNLGALRAE